MIQIGKYILKWFMGDREPLKGFRAIDSYPNYKVSREGRIWDGLNGRFAIPSLHRSGYFHLSLRDSSYKCGRRRFYLHHLVASAFLPNPEGKNRIRHLNGDKTDNRVENLEWITKSESQKDASDRGAWKRLSKGRFKRMSPNKHKLNEEKVGEIVELIKAKEKTATIARKYSVSLQSIYNIKHKKVWKRLTYKKL